MNKYEWLRKQWANATKSLAERDYPPGSVTKEMFAPRKPNPLEVRVSQENADAQDKPGN